jgi:hypothetical protein
MLMLQRRLLTELVDKGQGPPCNTCGEATLKRAAEIRRLALGSSHPLTMQLSGEYSMLKAKCKSA